MTLYFGPWDWACYLVRWPTPRVKVFDQVYTLREQVEATHGSHAAEVRRNAELLEERERREELRDYVDAELKKRREAEDVPEAE